jgi:hypothetical protein
MPGRSEQMLGLLIILIIALLLFGGVGYGYRSTWGNYYTGGTGLLGGLVLLLLILFLLGVIK